MMFFYMMMFAMFNAVHITSSSAGKTRPGRNNVIFCVSNAASKSG
jgi:hypothetical protein